MIYLEARITTADEDLWDLLEVVEQLAQRADDLQVHLELTAGLESLPRPSRARLQFLMDAMGDRFVLVEPAA